MNVGNYQAFHTGVMPIISLTNGERDIFVRDLKRGMSFITTPISLWVFSVNTFMNSKDSILS
jgi:hypothetical protein